ncbi:hypothetical protein ACVWW2_007180 [Bradyrhizobium sp. LM4.3]
MTSKTKAAALAGFLGVSIAFAGIAGAFGQAAPTSSSIKTIGTPAAAVKPEIVPSLFVMNSRGATLQGDNLVLTGVTPSSIIFADRPIRAAGHQATADVIAEWGSGEDSFAKNPPNATVSVLAKDGSVKDAVVVLKNPKLEGDKLTFTVQTLEGDLAGADGGGSGLHRYYRAAADAAIVCRSCSPFRIPRRNVCGRRRGRRIWSGRLCRALLSSLSATSGMRLLSLPALLLKTAAPQQTIRCLRRSAPFAGCA